MDSKNVTQIDPSTSLIDKASETMKQNQNFLLEHNKLTIDECIELMNDAIDELKINHKNNVLDAFFKSVLMPLSGSVYLNLLLGNARVAFVDLRCILESLAKSYFVNSKICSTTKGMQNLDQEFQLNGSAEKLWRKLSNKWVHTEGIFEKMAELDNDVPAWALCIPMVYNTNDIEQINELGQSISELRAIIKKVLVKC